MRNISARGLLDRVLQAHATPQTPATQLAAWLHATVCPSGVAGLAVPSLRRAGGHPFGGTPRNVESYPFTLTSTSHSKMSAFTVCYQRLRAFILRDNVLSYCVGR